MTVATSTRRDSTGSASPARRGRRHAARGAARPQRAHEQLVAAGALEHVLERFSEEITPPPIRRTNRSTSSNSQVAIPAPSKPEATSTVTAAGRCAPHLGRGVDEGGQQLALFQRRSQSKDTWPGALDVAVGGHLRAGGGFLAQAIREAEIRLDVTLVDLTRLGRRFAHGMAGKDNEVQEVFTICALTSRSARMGSTQPRSTRRCRCPWLLRSRCSKAAKRLSTVAGCRRRTKTPSAWVTVSGFAAGEAGGYAAHALVELL